MNISELERLPPADLYTLLDDIPSDNESVHSTYSSGDEEINDIDFQLSNEDYGPVVAPAVDWDSDDDLPLAVLVPGAKITTVPTFQWSKSVQNIVQPVPFSADSGPDVPIDAEVDCPLDIFMLLFSEELLQKLVFETNLYAFQNNTGNTYLPTTYNEMRCFLGLNILMGIKHLPSYKDYWSAREELRDHYIASCMSRNRFGWFLGNMHLNDKSVEPKKGEPSYDKLYKLRSMLERLSENYARFYKPTRCQAIDESMIRFKGRISFRQYMPMKPIKRGYKMWVRANETGFVSQFQIYTGNKNIFPTYLHHQTNILFFFFNRESRKR